MERITVLKTTLADVSLPSGDKIQLLRIHLQNADSALCKCILNNNCLAVVALPSGEERSRWRSDRRVTPSIQAWPTTTLHVLLIIIILIFINIYYYLIFWSSSLPLYKPDPPLLCMSCSSSSLWISPSTRRFKSWGGQYQGEWDQGAGVQHPEAWLHEDDGGHHGVRPRWWTEAKCWWTPVGKCWWWWWWWLFITTRQKPAFFVTHGGSQLTYWTDL